MSPHSCLTGPLEDRYVTTEQGVKIYPYRYPEDPALVAAFNARTSDEALRKYTQTFPKLDTLKPA